MKFLPICLTDSLKRQLKIWCFWHWKQLLTPNKKQIKRTISILNLKGNTWPKVLPFAFAKNLNMYPLKGDKSFFNKCGANSAAGHIVYWNIVCMANGIMVVHTFPGRAGNIQLSVRFCIGHVVFVPFFRIAGTTGFVTTTSIFAAYSNVWFATHIVFVICAGVNAAFKFCHNFNSSLSIILFA